MKLNIEIRAAEGGEDAKLLVQDQARVYESFAQQTGLQSTRTGQGPG